MRKKDLAGGAPMPSQYGRTFGYRTIVGVFRPVLLAGTRRDWRGVEHLPTDRGFIVVSNHVTLVRPGHPDALPVGQRFPAVLPDQGGRLPDPRPGPLDARGGADPGVPRCSRRRRVVGPGRGSHPGGQGGGYLSGGDHDEGPGPLADGRQDRRGAVGADDRVPGDPGRAVGYRADHAARADGARFGAPAYGPPARGAAGGSGRPDAAGWTIRRCCTRRPSGSWTASPLWWRSYAASRHRQRASTRARPPPMLVVEGRCRHSLGPDVVARFGTGSTMWNRGWERDRRSKRRGRRGVGACRR